MKIKFIVFEIVNNFNNIVAYAEFTTYEEAQKYIEGLELKGMYIINKVFFKL